MKSFTEERGQTVFGQGVIGIRDGGTLMGADGILLKRRSKRPPYNPGEELKENRPHL